MYPMQGEDINRIIREIPKAELHIHLDSVPPELLLRFARRNNVNLPFNDIGGALKWYQFSDLEEFLGKWKITTDVLLTETDYYETALDLGEDMQRQNILRREVMFTYAAAHEGRVPLEVMLRGLAKGRHDVKKIYDRDLYFIADIDRTIDPNRSLQYVDEIAECKDEVGILGIGLDCQEVGFPAEVHKDAFRRARERGLFLSAHAGEEFEAGPEGVRDVIRDLEVDRIDHGNQAIRDESLLALIVEKDIPMTLCPISNVSINIYPSLSDHPIIQLRNKGVSVTINSDDPPFFQNNLVDNYIKLTETFDLSREDIIQFARNSFSYCYASDVDKSKYKNQLDDWLENKSTVPKNIPDSEVE